MGEDLGRLVAEIRQASESISDSDLRTNKRIDAVEQSINKMSLRLNRPGSWETADADVAERKEAIGLCRIRRALQVPKIDAGVSDDYEPTSAEIEEGLVYRKALRKIWRKGNTDALDPHEKKSMSAFSFGTTDFVLPPTLSSQVLSCIVDPTDLAGQVNVVNISGPSIKFLIDNSRTSIAGWACESTCFANNPQPDLTAGLGELEIKPESLRFVACVTSDLLADSAFPLEPWILRKVSDAFRNEISNSIVAGDGLGRPMGFLNPMAGVPILDTSPSTPAGQFTWQDLVMLKYDVPMQWHTGGSFFMNQKTWALIATMSDALGRPLWTQLPGGQSGFVLSGSPVTIVTQMPDCLPGHTPVAFGNLRQAYTLVVRQATTMRPDPFTAGWCTLFRFDCGVGGNLTCANAMRLLRIR